MLNFNFVCNIHGGGHLFSLKIMLDVFNSLKNRQPKRMQNYPKCYSSGEVSLVKRKLIAHFSVTLSPDSNCGSLTNVYSLKETA